MKRDDAIAGWTRDEVRVLDTLDSPGRIGAFLDEVSYSSDPFYRCPRRVLADRKANCVDGALFAAACLRRIGHRPLVMEMTAYRDDDHFLAIFKRDGHLGAVAKSNFTGLRFREPIHRTLRELVVSYFAEYYNMEFDRSLRGYSRPIDLSAYDGIGWTTRDEAADAIIDGVVAAPHYPLLSPAQVAALTPIDRRTYDAGMLGVNPDGVYDPAKH